MLEMRAGGNEFSVQLFAELLPSNTTVWIIIHSKEAKNRSAIGTVPLLQLCLQNVKVLVDYKKGKQATVDTAAVFPELAAVIHSAKDRVLLMFPGEAAVPLQNYSTLRTPEQDLQHQEETESGFYHLVLLDGTWPQATSLLHRHPLLHTLPKVVLTDTG